ncbi:MAG: type II toxin-antitoxin system Phd/YefM family antitoxin [Burkholderiales bacterium]|nr:type II toxin-antitoxin system Phd/YefM family antitoxin [Burkholderiales bacterium]
MKTLSLSEAKAKLSGLVEQVERRGAKVVITRNGRPAAVLISPDEFESWKETLAIRADRALMREINLPLIRRPPILCAPGHHSPICHNARSAAVVQPRTARHAPSAPQSAGLISLSVPLPRPPLNLPGRC